MKNKARIVAVFLITATLGLAGCGNNNSSNSSPASTTTAATSTATAETEKANANNEFDIDEYIANYKPKTELTNKSLFDYEVKVNGAVLTCPISAAEIAALGYKANAQYTADLVKGEITRIYNQRYTNADTGVVLVFDTMSTSSNNPIKFDSESPRDDVFFYNLDFNTKEFWEHADKLEAEFYGGTITNYYSEYISDTAVITSENDVIKKCGDYTQKSSYYEFPDDDKPEANKVSFWTNDKKNISGIKFFRTPDKAQK